jgi:hypothetical protein
MRGDKRWRLTNCLRFWWIDWRGTVEERCIRYVPGEVGRIAPVANGFVAEANGEYSRDADEQQVGLYTLDENGQQPLRITNLPPIPFYHPITVSPDGCKVAVILASNAKADDRASWHSDNLTVVDICQF